MVLVAVATAVISHLGQSSHDTASKEVPQSDIAIIVITAYVQASLLEDHSPH